MGKQPAPQQDINTVMKHDFLRQSMENKIEKKIMQHNFNRQQNTMQKNKRIAASKAHSRRSQSVLASVKVQDERYGSPHS